MAYYLLNVAISVSLVVAIAEISRRGSLVAALLASVPLVSVLAMIWLFIDTRDTEKVSAFANNIFWLVLPSLALFVALPPDARTGNQFLSQHDRIDRDHGRLLLADGDRARPFRYRVVSP
jgi:hypothetical protein